MPDRPGISAAIVREILIECGHRCAVCCEGVPLQRAHIIPWHKSLEHKAADLICLCANCHQRADTEKWGEKTLRQYKLKPCIFRRLDSNEALSGSTAQVEITLNINLEEFDETQQTRLAVALSSFAEVAPNAVHIKAVIQNSVIAVIELPEQAAEKVVAAYEHNDELLSAYLFPLDVIGVKMVAPIYVGTIVGESTTREFRLAVKHEAIREQDIIAVNATLSRLDNGSSTDGIRVWAKVQRIERINPLFPIEAGHELAETQTDPFDTVLSLSREMVTAVCQVLGAEPLSGGKGGKLDQLRYPAKPATSAYRPNSTDIARVVLGELGQKQNRALDIATLSNRPEVDVKIDGHAIVTRHLAILAMTGAGKSWTARRIIEQLAAKNYPIVIFDPHGDYTGLADVDTLKGKVKRFYAQLPIFEEAPEKVASIVESLAWELSDNQRLHFETLFKGARTFLQAQGTEQVERRDWIAEYVGNDKIKVYGLQPNLYFFADFVQAIVRAGKEEDQETFAQIQTWANQDYSKRISRQVAGRIEGIIGRLRTAAKAIRRMEEISRRIARQAEPLPQERIQLVQYGQVSVISLAGYTGDFQATIYSIIASDIFDARVRNALKLPALFLLEEAHNFVPSKAASGAEERSITITKQIAQEGRKFGVGLILISQRPSRLDETALAMCNSYIIMRMVNPADQNFVRRVVESLGEDDAAMLPNLDVGEALLSGQIINFPVLVKIKEPESKGEHEEEDAFKILEEAHKEMTK